MMRHAWSGEDRRELGRLFDAAAPDPSRAAAMVRRMVARLARAVPSTHRGVEILPLLESKLAGYNADLFGHARRALRSAAAADALLAASDLHSIAFGFDDMYLAEHAVACRVRARAGTFDAESMAVRSGAALAGRYGRRWSEDGRERHEIDLLSARGAPADGIGGRRAEGAGSGRTVLFVASMNNYLLPMVPVMGEVLSRGCGVALLMPRASEGWAHAGGIPAGVLRLHVEDAVTGEMERLFRDERRRVRAFLGAHEADLRGCFDAEGVDLWPVVRDDITTFLADYLPYGAVMAELAHTIRAGFGIDACVVARLRRATESVLAAALREAGVPVTMLIHGHVSNSPERAFDTGSFRADRVCVWGHAQRLQVLGADDAPPEGSVVVTGNGAWDTLIAGRNTDDRGDARRRLADDLSLDPDRLWVVYTAQDITRGEFPAVVDAFVREAGALMVVKPHPAEDPGWYRAGCGGLAGAVVLDHGRVDLHGLLRAADLCLTFSSTTNLEALILGTPVVTLVFGGLAAQDRAAYLEECGLPLARNTEELRSILTAGAGDRARMREAMAPAVERARRRFVANYPEADGARRAADAVLGPVALRTGAGCAA